MPWYGWLIVFCVLVVCGTLVTVVALTTRTMKNLAGDDKPDLQKTLKQRY